MTTPPSADSFRRLMARWPTGVAVVTAREGDRDFGLTVNALVSVALRPPTLLISLDRNADSTPVVSRTLGFAVSFLGAAQRPLSERFARAIASAEKFHGVALHRAASGRALLDGAQAMLDCRVVGEIPAVDHQLFLGEVVEEELPPEGPPLVFHRSGYTGVSGERL